MEEVESAKTDAASSEATSPVPAFIAATPESINLETEGFSWLQKGLFLGVILGCVAAYIRMNSKKDKRYAEKSMA